jgi:hypothetical protein
LGLPVAEIEGVLEGVIEGVEVHERVGVPVGVTLGEGVEERVMVGEGVEEVEANGVNVVPLPFVCPLGVGVGEGVEREENVALPREAEGVEERVEGAVAEPVGAPRQGGVPCGPTTSPVPLSKIFPPNLHLPLHTKLYRIGL